MEDRQENDTPKEGTPKQTSKIPCKTRDTGTTSLVLGAGLGTYGTAMAVSTGYICPLCVIAAPLFLSIGAVQKYKYLKNKQTQKKDQPTT